MAESPPRGGTRIQRTSPHHLQRPRDTTGLRSKTTSMKASGRLQEREKVVGECAGDPRPVRGDDSATALSLFRKPLLPHRGTSLRVLVADIQLRFYKNVGDQHSCARASVGQERLAEKAECGGRIVAAAALDADLQRTPPPPSRAHGADSTGLRSRLSSSPNLSRCSLGLHLCNHRRDGLPEQGTSTGARLPLRGPCEADLAVHPLLTAGGVDAGTPLGFGGSPRAGAVVTGRGAWLIRGDKEAGKSTLLARFHERGPPIVADDVAILDGGRASSGPRRFDLRA